MKITFVKSTFFGPASGGDRVLLYYASRLRAAGHFPSVLLIEPPDPQNHYYRQLKEAGVPVSCVVHHPVYWGLRFARLLTRFGSRVTKRLPVMNTGRMIYAASLYYLRRRHPDVVHVLEPTEGMPEMIRAARAAGIPVLYHEIRTPRETMAVEPWTQSWYDGIKKVMPLCTEVAAVSPRLARVCREDLAYRGPVCVLPFLVDRPVNGEVGSQPPGACLTFGFAAAIYPLKGPTVLLDAFAQILKKFPDARLKMAGAGRDEQAVKAHAEALGLGQRCEFPGPYAGPGGLTAFMRSVNVFVLPSFTEGTSTSVIEAMAHGLPIVASAVGGMPDVVSPETGILVPPGDVSALAEALSRLAGDAALRERMGQAARQRYEQLFSPEAVTRILLDTYRRVAGNDNGASRVARRGHKCEHPWAAGTSDALRKQVQPL